MDISPDEDVTRTAQSTPASVRYGSLKKTVLFGKKRPKPKACLVGLPKPQLFFSLYNLAI